MLRRFLSRAPAAVCHIYTLFFTLIGWVLFAFEDLGAGLRYLGAMFGAGAPLFSQAALYQLASFWPLLLLCGVCSTPLGKRLHQRLGTGTAAAGSGLSDGAGSADSRAGSINSGSAPSGMRQRGILCAADALCLLALFGLSLVFLISGSYNPFLYFRF